MSNKSQRKAPKISEWYGRKKDLFVVRHPDSGTWRGWFEDDIEDYEAVWADDYSDHYGNDDYDDGCYYYNPRTDEEKENLALYRELLWEACAGTGVGPGHGGMNEGYYDSKCYVFQLLFSKKVILNNLVTGNVEFIEEGGLIDVRMSSIHNYDPEHCVDKNLTLNDPDFMRKASAILNEVYDVANYNMLAYYSRKKSA